eukprot:GFUD01018167.1.p1 GENE.GFUD01018167.1~~GFUD01018167.1.p1  ORF type:complete len:125 (+),score=57.55 GFUD01018167.1:87-461(+)
MSSLPPTTDSSKIQTGGIELNFKSVPSGREVLMDNAEKLIAQYNKSVEADEKMLEKVKRAVQNTSEMVINMLEEKMYKKQMMMNEKMQEVIVEINTQLEQLEGQEEELKNFSAGLAMFMGDLKS